MKAKARLLKVENISGTSKSSGKPYNMNVGHFLDMETFDKVRLSIPDNDLPHVTALVTKEGVLDVGYDPRTEKLSFVAFRIAA